MARLGSLWHLCSVLLVTAALAQTDQRPGPNGEFGKAIQVGAQRPVYFTLKSLEYRPDRNTVDHYVFAPSEDQKLVVMHYAIQNPTKKAIDYQALYPTFEIFDSENVGYAMGKGIAVGLEDTKKRPQGQLQPAQTIHLYTSVLVPRQARLVKLIVLPDSATEPVVRYKIEGKVAPLKPPFADPADATGETAALDLPARLGDTFPMAWYDATVTGPREGLPGPTYAAPRGAHWVAYGATLRLVTKSQRTVGLAVLPAVLTLASGTEIKVTSVHGLDGWQMLNQEVRPDSELKVRLLFAVPDGAEVKSLRFRVAGLDNSWRKYTHSAIYDLTPPPPPPPPADGAK